MLARTLPFDRPSFSALLVGLGLLAASAGTGCGGTDTFVSNGGTGGTSATGGTGVGAGTTGTTTETGVQCGMITCPVGALCISGVCQCGAGQVNCQDGCYDLSADPDHCGNCDHACKVSQTCESGQCGACP